MPGTVLVSVGSTKFDALIQAVDDVAVAAVLSSLGYTELVIQRGRGSYVISNLLKPGEQRGQLAHGLSVHCFEYLPSITEHIQNSRLIICHAGAGSIFEGLQAQKLLVVVPNALLMHNHQVELAEKLESMGHLIAATPQTLLHKLQYLPQFTPVPYPPGNPQKMARRIDQLFFKKRV